MNIAKESHGQNKSVNNGGRPHFLMKDYSLYRFSTINKNLIDSLVKGYLFFAKPEKLNDPFDCRLDISKAMNKAMETAIGSHSRFGLDRLKILINDGENFELREKAMHEWGVCSFSKALKSDKEPLMWSHYADNHRGIRILYEIPYQFIFDNTNVDNILVTSTVKYDIDPLTNWFIRFANSEKEIDDGFAVNTINDILLLSLTSKNPCWDYENEMRIIRKIPGKFNIPKSFLKQICFGLHASDEDVALIKEIVGNYEHEVNLCRVVRADSDFGIDYEDI